MGLAEVFEVNGAPLFPSDILQCHKFEKLRSTSGRRFSLSETACDGEIWKLHQVPEFSCGHRVRVLENVYD